MRKYANAREIVWCQEEPQNQGGWYQIRHRLQAPLEPKDELLYAGRAGAAAPATGIIGAPRATAEESGRRPRCKAFRRKRPHDRRCASRRSN